MNPIEIERDMPECEKWNQGDEHDENTPTTYERAAEDISELQREVDDNYLRDAMQEMI